jgi:hypothetical protein
MGTIEKGLPFLAKKACNLVSAGLEFGIDRGTSGE